MAFVRLELVPDAVHGHADLARSLSDALSLRAGQGQGRPLERAPAPGATDLRRGPPAAAQAGPPPGCSVPV